MPPFPLNVNVPLFELIQVVVTAGEIVPPAGDGFTVTVTFAVFVHPIPLVPVTVYVVVFDGLAVTVDPVEEDKPVEGFQT